MPAPYKKIESPERMLEYFNSYVHETKNNPYTVPDWVGQQATPIHREKERPLTLEGFQVYMSKIGVCRDLKDYFANTKDSYADFVLVCADIRNQIRCDQIEGGMAGMYNPQITQRLNGLVDKTESKIDGNINITFDIT
jgi:hypothetical protein